MAEYMERIGFHDFKRLTRLVALLSAGNMPVRLMSEHEIERYTVLEQDGVIELSIRLVRSSRDE